MGQKASILGAKTHSIKKLDERKQEQEKDADDSKVTIEKVQLEVQKELKQLSEANLKREQEQQKVINILQEQAKESSLLVKGLTSDLDDVQHKIAIFDNKVHQLETQVMDEQQTSASLKKKGEELELEIRKVRKQLETEINLQRVMKELEDEKAAREEAWAKISALELEMNVAIRELDYEKRRLKVASEKIMLVETHLQEFHSIGKDMKQLFGKQMEQVKEMQRTLMEDEEIHKKTSIDADLNEATEEDKNASHTSNGTVLPSSISSTKIEANESREGVKTSSVTKKEVKAPVLVLQMTGI